MPFAPGYKVDELGRLFSCHRPAPGGLRIWRPLDIHLWYGRWRCTIHLPPDSKPASYKMSVVMARSFIGEKPDGHKLYHLDRDSTNHKLANLAYLTRSQAHAIGIYRTPATFNNRKLTEEQVIGIRRDFFDGKMTLTEVSIKWQQSRENTRAILTRKTFGKLDDGYPAMGRGQSGGRPTLLTPDEIRDIQRQSVAGVGPTAIWKAGYEGRCSSSRVSFICRQARRALCLPPFPTGPRRRSSTTAGSTTRPPKSSSSSPPETGTTTSSTPVPEG